MYKQCRIAFISSIVLLIILLSLYILEPLAQMSVKRKMEKFHIETITIVPTIPYIRVTEPTIEETEPEIEVEFDGTMPTVDYTKHHLTKSSGIFEGPSGRETYYNVMGRLWICACVPNNKTDGFWLSRAFYRSW